MATEMQPAFDVEMFALRSSEMAAALESGQLEPIQGSPLLGLSAEADESAREMVRQTGHGVQAAIKRIASPDRVVGVVTASPPEPADFLWLFGVRGDLDFAYHQEDDTGLHRLAWPVDGLALIDVAAASLDLEEPIEHFGVSLALGREEFSALAAISDFVQADALQGILRHDPPLPDPPTFKIEDLLALADRATQSGDLRWMVSRARLLSPVELDFGEGTIGPALVSLYENGLLQEANGLYEITPLLHKVCLLVGTCFGFSALSSRNKVPETGGWSLDHFALSRGPEVLLLFEFEDVSATDFLVSIDDITPSLAFEWLRGGLILDDPMVEVDDEPAPPLPPPPHPEPAELQQRFCVSCGAAVGSDKGFCTQCGKPVVAGGADV